MAAPFLGLNVHVKLKNPPSSLHGHVFNVEGQRLHLRDVHFLKSGKRLRDYTIHGAEIEDIEVLPAGTSLLQEPSASKLDGQKLSARTAIQPATEAIVTTAASTPHERPSSSVPSHTFRTRNAHDSPARTNATQPIKPQRLPGLRPAQLPPAAQNAFVDPAILTYERTPTEQKAELSVVAPAKIGTFADPAIVDSTNTNALVDGASSLAGLLELAQTSSYTNGTSQKAALASIVDVVGNPAEGRGSGLSKKLSATLSAPFDVLHLDQSKTRDEENKDTLNAVEPLGEVDVSSTGAGATGKSGRRKKKRPNQKSDLAVASEFDASRELVRKPALVADNASTGWRETPILHEQMTPGLLQERRSQHQSQEANSHRAGPNYSRKSLPRRHERALPREADKNGWATEDATDVQGMGDFDFIGNLSKFDKKSVWDELRIEDTTADEDRLVSFNRVKAPGTFGGQKLHPTENVLGRSRTASQDYQSDSDANLDAAAAISVRQLRRDQSRTSVRQPSSRKGSLKNASYTASPAPTSTNRFPTTAKLSDIPISYSPRLQGYTSPSSSVFSRSGQAPGSQSQSTLRYTATNRSCRTVSPETLVAIENLSHNGFALPEDILAENAGRGIAEVVLSTVDPGGHRLGQSNHNALPVIVVLVGENKTGARALAAARHLIGRNVRVLASLTGRVDLETGPLSAQVQRFRGKIIRSWEDTSMALKNLDTPPELIIDALLGAHDSFDTLPPDHFGTALEMLAWANRSRASVLSIDIPSGVDAITGQVQIREGEPVEIRARLVVCCGIPCTGLMQAMVARGNEESWKIFVADLGINPAARPFMRMNTNQVEGEQKGRFINFGTKWVVGLSFDPGPGVQ